MTRCSRVRCCGDHGGWLGDLHIRSRADCSLGCSPTPSTGGCHARATDVCRVEDVRCQPMIGRKLRRPRLLAGLTAAITGAALITTGLTQQAAAAPCTTRTMYVVAHADDSL